MTDATPGRQDAEGVMRGRSAPPRIFGQANLADVVDVSDKLGEPAQLRLSELLGAQR